MKTVMISGHFDPFHYGHLEFIKEASKMGYLLCVVSSDGQVKIKKGKINEPSYERLEIIHWVLTGLQIKARLVVNTLDADVSVAEALRFFHPDIFCRGSDKTLEDMPVGERKACDELCIEIVHITSDKQAHGSEFVF